MTEAAAAPRGPLAWAGQALLYGFFALLVGVFTTWPVYHALQPNDALIKLSFSHAGKPVTECRKRTPEELAKLPPNMRAPTVCPRERSPVTVEVDLNGTTVLKRIAPPTGLSKDGASAVYERLVVPAGEHLITVRLSDDVRARDQAYRHESTVKLVPGQVLVIDFDAGKGGITLQ